MVGERIKRLRKTLKMSQAEFARAVGLSNGYVADLENDNKYPSHKIIRLISLTFGVNEAWLKDGTGEMLLTSPADKAQRITSLFNELPPNFQDYVVAQVQQLLAAIEKGQL